MKKTFYVLLLLVMCLLASCGKDAIEEPKPIVHSYGVKLNRNELTGGYAESYGYVSISTEETVAWTATSSADWLTVSPSSGTGNAVLQVSWQENATASDRTATITVTDGETRATLTVKQGQKPAQLVSTRAIFGNLIKSERDSVEFIFDKPVRRVSVQSKSEFYYIDDKVDKTDADGCRWRLPLLPSRVGDEMRLALSYWSATDGAEHKQAVAVPFYDKKYLVTQEHEWINNTTLSSDKQSLWIAVGNWEADLNRVMQVSLDDMTEVQSIKMPFEPTFLCVNPYNGLLYVMGNQDYFCVVDPASGTIVKRVQIEVSPYAHPQYPENCAAEVAFTKDGFGILRLISSGTTGMEWRYIDSADDDKITLSGYDWSEHQFEHLYTNYDYSRIYASIYPSLYSPLEWIDRQHQEPVEVPVSPKFQSDKYYAGGNLMDLRMSPFANKAFICTAPGSECVVSLEPLSYSEVLEVEARDSKCAWDEVVTDRDYVYQFCAYDGYMQLYDMTAGRCIFGARHRFVGNSAAKNCHFLPATDQLVISALEGVWVFDAAALKARKL